MSNPNSKNKLWLWISEDTSQNVNDICEQAHTTAFARNNFLTLKSDALKENIEADFVLYCISERDLKLSHTNLLFTRRCPNETMVPHLKWVHLLHQATAIRYGCQRAGWYRKRLPSGIFHLDKRTHTCAHYQHQQGKEERVLSFTEILAVKYVMKQRGIWATKAKMKDQNKSGIGKC